jgi:hypothetical protein
MDMGQSSSVGPGSAVPSALPGAPPRSTASRASEAALLVGPQPGVEARGRLHRREGAIGAAGEQVAEPAVGVDAGQGEGQVGVVVAGGQRQHVGRAQRTSPRRAQELEALPQLVLVHADPGPPQPHQRRLRGDERGYLLLVEHRVGAVADGHGPVEVGNLLAAEPAADDDAGRRSAAGGQAQPDPAPAVPAGGQLHAEPGLDQQGRSRGKHLVGAVEVEVEHVRAGSAQCGREWRVDPRGPA